MRWYLSFRSSGRVHLANVDNILEIYEDGNGFAWVVLPGGRAHRTEESFDTIVKRLTEDQV